MSNTEIDAGDIIPKLSNSNQEDFYSTLKILRSKSQKNIELENFENESTIRMRILWGYTILGSIVAIALFDMIMIWMYGKGTWKFSDSDVVIAIVADGLLKVVGLGYLITQNIFRKIYKS